MSCDFTYCEKTKSEIFDSNYPLKHFNRSTNVINNYASIWRKKLGNLAKLLWRKDAWACRLHKIVQIRRNEVILQVFTLAFHVKVFKFTCCVAAASPLYSQNIFYDCNTILKHCKLLIVLRPCANWCANWWDISHNSKRNAYFAIW